MAAKTSSPAAAFAKVLRAFETGGFTSDDVLVELKKLLADGTSRAEFFEVLQHRDLLEPLPAVMHAEILALLNAEIEWSPDAAADLEAAANARESAADAREPLPPQSALIADPWEIPEPPAPVTPVPPASKVGTIPMQPPARPVPTLVPDPAIDAPRAAASTPSPTPGPTSGATSSPAPGPNSGATSSPTPRFAPPLKPAPDFTRAPSETRPLFPPVEEPLEKAAAAVDPTRRPVTGTTVAEASRLVEAPRSAAASRPVEASRPAEVSPPVETSRSRPIPTSDEVRSPVTPRSPTEARIPIADVTAPAKAAATPPPPAAPASEPATAVQPPPPSGPSIPARISAATRNLANVVGRAFTPEKKPATTPEPVAPLEQTALMTVEMPVPTPTPAPRPAVSELLTVEMPLLAAQTAASDFRTVEMPTPAPATSRSPNSRPTTSPPLGELPTMVSTALPSIKAPPPETAPPVVKKPIPVVTPPPPVVTPPPVAKTPPVVPAPPPPPVVTPPPVAKTPLAVPAPPPPPVVTPPSVAKTPPVVPAPPPPVAKAPATAPSPPLPSTSSAVPPQERDEWSDIGGVREEFAQELAAIREAASGNRVASQRAPLRSLGLIAAALVAVFAWFHWHKAPVEAPVAQTAPPPTPGTTIRDCATCTSMTVLPVGRFKQGAAGNDSGALRYEKPQHWVRIAHPIAMSTNLVTVDEFREFAQATGRDMQGCETYDGTWKARQDNNWDNPGFAQTGVHPVTCVSWNDADAYAHWLSAKTGHVYRLPSASEWEYASRGGSEVAQPWLPNGANACDYANVADAGAAHKYPGWMAFACDDGYVNTAPVGSFKANPFSLFDMLGNTFQWTQDCWHPDYKGAPVDGSARTDGDCTERELRGGSWFTPPAYVRANYRNHFGVDYRTSTVGIRLVRELEP